MKILLPFISGQRARALACCCLLLPMLNGCLSSSQKLQAIGEVAEILFCPVYPAPLAPLAPLQQSAFKDILTPQGLPKPQVDPANVTAPPKAEGLEPDAAE